MKPEDLYTLDAHTEGAECRLVSPIDGKLTDCYIKVVGVDSVTWREAELRVKRQNLEYFKNAELSSDERKRKVLESTAEVLSEATLSWRGFEVDGKEIEFSKEKVKQLYINSPAIADQVDLFIGKRANFTKG